MATYIDYASNLKIVLTQGIVGDYAAYEGTASQNDLEVLHMVISAMMKRICARCFVYTYKTLISIDINLEEAHGQQYVAMPRKAWPRAYQIGYFQSG